MDPTFKIEKIDSKTSNYDIVLRFYDTDVYCAYTFIRYTGDSFVHMGTVRALDTDKTWSYTTNSKGEISFHAGSSVLQSWDLQKIYTINQNKLTLLNNNNGLFTAFEPNKVTVKKDFKAYTQKNKTAKQIQLKKDDVITLQGTDNKQWVKGITQNGETIWIVTTPEKGDIFGAIIATQITGYGSGVDYLDGLQEWG